MEEEKASRESQLFVLKIWSTEAAGAASSTRLSKNWVSKTPSGGEISWPLLSFSNYTWLQCWTAELEKDNNEL